jgi:hypothetical protein
MSSILADIQAGKHDEPSLCERTSERLRPLRDVAAQAAAKQKAAASAHGQFVLQLATVAGKALSSRKLAKNATQVLLEVARHALEGLFIIAPFAKCKQPLQLEKMAMGLIQKHVDARSFDGLLALVDRLAQLLATTQGGRSEKGKGSCGKVTAALSHYPMYALHSAELREGFLRAAATPLAPQAGDPVELCSLASSCLNARAACLLFPALGAEEGTERARAACCAALLWVEHAGTLGDAAATLASRRCLTGELAPISRAGRRSLCPPVGVLVRCGLDTYSRRRRPGPHDAAGGGGVA